GVHHPSSRVSLPGFACLADPVSFADVHHHMRPMREHYVSPWLRKPESQVKEGLQRNHTPAANTGETTRGQGGKTEKKAEKNRPDHTHGVRSGQLWLGPLR
ncbi:MAG: hypothetical protein ACK5JO_10145, partial [Halodesulfovibrio sp.]